MGSGRVVRLLRWPADIALVVEGRRLGLSSVGAVPVEAGRGDHVARDDAGQNAQALKPVRSCSSLNPICLSTPVSCGRSVRPNSKLQAQERCSTTPSVWGA